MRIYYALTHTTNCLNRPIITEWQKELLYFRFPSELSFQLADTSNEIFDFIFLGSSHAYRNFNPRLFESFGYSCLNLGSSSQTPQNSIPLLKKYLHKCDNIILEVYPATIGIDGTEAFYVLNNDLNDKMLLAEMSANINNFRVYNLLSIHSWLKESLKHLKIDTTNFYKGYIATYDSVKPTIKYDTILISESTAINQLKYIEDAIKICRNEKKKLYLVYAPVPSKLIIDNETFVIKRLKELSEAYNICFLNWGRNHNLIDKEHFFDDDHLNNAGVEIFNMHLLKSIKKADE
ncbi:MAG: hypothetical protein ACK4ON_09605 [Bacteroidia bacterium]